MSRSVEIYRRIGIGVSFFLSFFLLHSFSWLRRRAESGEAFRGNGRS